MFIKTGERERSIFCTEKHLLIKRDLVINTDQMEKIELPQKITSHSFAHAISGLGSSEAQRSTIIQENEPEASKVKVCERTLPGTLEFRQSFLAPIKSPHQFLAQI